jgi:hypothetical protein
MTVTLELKPSIEARIIQQAAASGLPLEDFLESMLEIRFGDNGGHEKSFHETATPDEWVKAWDEFVKSHAYITAPSLSLEAISRDSIYTREDDILR